MSKFDHLLENGYEFEMNRYFNEGWELFKKGAGSFIGFTLLLYVIALMVGLVPFVSIVSGIIQAALTAGIFLFCRGLVNGNEDFSQFFEGFNHFGQIFLHYLVLFLFFIPFIVLFFTVIFPFELLPEMISGGFNPEDFARDFGYLLEGRLVIFIPSVFITIAVACYLTISYSFVLALIVDEGMQFWQAMELSRKVIGKKFFPFLGMFIILGLLAAITTIVSCGLGLLVATPLIYCIIFAAYENILQPKKDTVTSQIKEFGQQEKDINTELEDS